MLVQRFGLGMIAHGFFSGGGVGVVGLEDCVLRKF